MADPQNPKTTASPDVPGSSDKAAAEPSGSKGDNPSTAGAGKTAVRSNTPENRLGHLNPSAPEDANITPGSMNEK